MTTHATADKHWTESELEALSIEHGFRLRGLEVTRLDTFIDAAFAFAVTLLVISFDEIPENLEEMLNAVKRIPAFSASFFVLMMFWLQHRRWSRRYGLENGITILFSLMLIFVALVFVFPLRIIFESMFAHLSGGFLPSGFRNNSVEGLRVMFAFYSSGSLAMSAIVSRLHRAALQRSSLLCLNDVEQLRTRTNMRAWAIVAAFSLLSILLAIFLPDGLVPLAGYLYFLLFPLFWLTGRYSKAGIA